MASEITYAEVKFKNASPAAVVGVPPETKKQEHYPQRYPPWLPWLISLLLLLVCVALVVILLVAPFSHSSDQPTTLQEKFSEWACVSAVSQGKGWTCCPKGWKRFQKSCYFLSSDLMSWNESLQNCTGMGSQLVVINSKEEQEFLSKQLRQMQNHVAENFYIGLREESVDQWQWVDKTPYNETVTFWRSGEPSEGNDEKCVVIHVETQPPNNWNDIGCMKHHRICEAAVISV
ncbi:CLC4A protein, partial [Pitta sordida]|nr:CLC4A protein [Pitta sordida]